jgi:hypothetical protein
MPLVVRPGLGHNPMMRFSLSAALVALGLFATTAAHADPSNLPSPGDRTVGMGLAATGVVVTGAGGYFIFKSQSDGASPSEGKLAVALTAGGIITTAAGLVLWLSPPPATEKKKQAPKPRSALLVGPTSAWYRLEL